MTFGSGLTVSVSLVESTQPAEEVATMVYVVVAVGEATTVDPVEGFKLEEGVQLIDAMLLPVAKSCVESPKQIAGWPCATIVGSGFTVKQLLAVDTQLFASVTLSV